MVDARVLYAVIVRSTQHKKNKFAIPADQCKVDDKVQQTSLFATEEGTTDIDLRYQFQSFKE